MVPRRQKLVFKPKGLGELIGSVPFKEHLCPHFYPFPATALKTWKQTKENPQIYFALTLDCPSPGLMK